MPTRKYPLFVITSFAATANRKSRSATVLYSDQWPSGGGERSPRFSLSRTAKIESALTLSASNFIRRNSISALLSQSAVDLKPVPRRKPASRQSAPGSRLRACHRRDGRRSPPRRPDRVPGNQGNNVGGRLSQSALRLPLRHRAMGIHRFRNLLG